MKSFTKSLFFLLFTLLLVKKVAADHLKLNLYVPPKTSEKWKINQLYFSLITDTSNYSSILKIPKKEDIDTIVFYKFTQEEIKHRYFKKSFSEDYFINIIENWCHVSRHHWYHGGYSHVAHGDFPGIIRLKNDEIIYFFIRPGGLAYLSFKNGAFYMVQH